MPHPDQRLGSVSRAPLSWVTLLTELQMRPRLSTWVKMRARFLSLDTIFARIFQPFSTQLHFTFLTPSFSLMLIPVMFMFYADHAHEQMTRTQFDWYDRTPNDSSTGLPTSRNSPVVVPHLDPALEPLPPPPNAPTTQSSRLPGHRA